MSFISMNLIGPYKEIENGNQYALTIICMLTNYIFMIPIRSKSTKDIMKAYHTGVYSTFRASKHILSDHDSEFTSKQFKFWAKELGFIKVYTSPYSPTGNSTIECTHSFLKASIRKFIYDHKVDWDETVHIATMANKVYPYSSAGKYLFYLMFGCGLFMLTLFKLLLPKCRYMGDEKSKIHLDTI